MKNLVFFCLFLYWFPLVVHSESTDLEKDKAFFKEVSTSYTKWIKANFPPNTIQLYSTCKQDQNCPVDYQKGKYVLFIELVYAKGEKLEIAKAKWENIKKSFEEEKKNGFTFEEILFYKMLEVYDLKKEEARIEFYDTYDSNLKPELEGFIEHDGNKVNPQIIKYRNIEKVVSLPKIKGFSKKSTEQIDITIQKSREDVYKRIETFIKQKLEKKKCENRNPKVEVIDSEENLEIEATELCKEVFSQDSDHALAKIINTVFKSNVNWNKRERLKLIFKYIVDSKTGVRNLSVNVNGKYGDGFFKPREKGYHNMEPEFIEVLEHYVNVLKEELKRELKK